MDSLEHLLTFVPPAEVLRQSAVSRAWAGASVSDAVWQVQCERLWADKVYVPARFLPEAPARMSRLDAFRGSVEDAARTAITAEELCEFEWSSRMKGGAGDLTSGCPWWTGTGPAQVRRYHADGTSGSQRGDTWRFV